VPRLLLSKREAAEALGMSPDLFRRHVLPELRLVYVGSRVLVPLAELEAWVEREAS
jgi:hypothetical protein